MTGLYSSKDWKRRREYQLAIEPLCRICNAAGISTPAIVADHIERHAGDPEKFFEGALQSLCKQCHDSIKQSEEKLGYNPQIGADGWPIDPAHPINRRK